MVYALLLHCMRADGNDLMVMLLLLLLLHTTLPSQFKEAHRGLATGSFEYRLRLRCTTLHYAAATTLRGSARSRGQPARRLCLRRTDQPWERLL